MKRDCVYFLLSGASAMAHGWRWFTSNDCQRAKINNDIDDIFGKKIYWQNMKKIIV